MNIITLLSFSFIITVSANAQNNPNYKITYRHCQQYDTSRKIFNTVGFEAVLIGNSSTSNYVFLKNPDSLQKQQNNPEDELSKALKEQKTATSTVRLTVGTRSDAIGNLVFFDKKKDSILLREKTMNDYILTYEKTPVIDWLITNETKKINDYNCTKATAHFRGRDYEAWFTTDIPIVEGPWKFKGLPGLILSIEDSKMQIYIYATDIKYPVTDEIPPFVASGRKISQNEYVNFRDKDDDRVRQSFEQTVAGQENFDKSKLSPKIKKTTAMFGIEKEAN